MISNYPYLHACMLFSPGARTIQALTDKAYDAERRAVSAREYADKCAAELEAAMREIDANIRDKLRDTTKARHGTTKALRTVIKARGNSNVA